MVALAHANGDRDHTENFVKAKMLGVFQSATPTFLDAGRPDAGKLMSCFFYG